MALFVDNQTADATLKQHFCRICKKGFGCGRALGGHMRAHGISGEDSCHLIDDDDDDDLRNNDEEDEDDEWDDDDKTNPTPSSKRMYALRANPNNRLRSCRACEHCGKEFSSWKSFLEHGKCVSDDEDDNNPDDSLVSSSPPDSGHWSKRKRSFRAIAATNTNTNANSNKQICPSSEEEDLANCLMMLSNAAVDPEPEESCASASRDEIDQKRSKEEPKNSMMMQHYDVPPISFRIPEQKATKGVFECKACKKVFNSHQALGGHRASHKKVKGCFAARLHDAPDPPPPGPPQPYEDEENHGQLVFAPAKANTAANNSRRSKVHECSICHRIFSSGQALGGHKRCHWITSNAGAASVVGPGPEATAVLAKFQESIEQINLAAIAAAAAATAQHHHANNNNINNNNAVAAPAALDLKLDLNLPAESDEESKKKKKSDDEVAMASGSAVMEDEADSKVKLAKLSELKDMTGDEGSSPWLQVGIGSTTDVGSTVP